MASALRTFGALVFAAASFGGGAQAADDSPLAYLVERVSTRHANYALLTYLPDPNTANDADYGFAQQPTELKIQVSLQVPVFPKGVPEVFGEGSALVFAFTQTAWWQLEPDSAPFRETNYEPEMFFERPIGGGFGGFDDARWRFGYVHQSNGQRGVLSRSWNRLRGELDLRRGETLGLRLRAWYRQPEAAIEDDNPDITEYLGYGDIALRWSPSHHHFGFRLKNPLHQKRGIELDWAIHTSKDGEPAWLIQLYHGYGESLIDYDYRITRIGVGFMLGDLL